MHFTLLNPYFNAGDEIPKQSIVVNVTQFTTLSRTAIIQHLITAGKLSPQLVDATVLTVNPRNFYFDVLLAKDYTIYYDQDQVPPEEPGRARRLIKLPLNLEVVQPDPEWALDCQAESVTLAHFTLLRKIGQGTYAQIFLVERKWDRRLFCMKRINKAECREKGSLAMVTSEYEVLEFPSKYKVKLFYQFEDSRFAYFVIEYCAHGDLYSVIKNNRKGEQSSRLTLTQKYLIWMQIAFGIVSLHEKGLIYRDLKPQNILLNENGEVKICDFGFTAKIDLGQKMTQLCGSYEYLAPEVIRREGYNKSVDLYCLGLLFYELLVGNNPFEGLTPETIAEMKSKPINYEKKSLSNTPKDLIKKLLKDKPEERLGYDSSLELFRHEFFKQNEDLVIKIINNKVLLKNLRYSEPQKLAQRQELSEKVAYVLAGHGCFNYLKPFFNVTENAGPKLNFTK